jgi:hypothetical protein
MSNTISGGDLRTIKDALFAGRKIEAVKLYREYSGMGLKDAKDAVEELEKKLMAESPERFQTEQMGAGKQNASGSPNPGVQVGKGCFGMVFVGLALAGMLLLSIVVAFGH